jgi:aryl-alcohol dehydrogenase-like predicted oxidoreductase
MKYHQMGKTGLRVSELCLGAMTFGRETTEGDSFKILDRFVEAEISLTLPMYIPPGSPKKFWDAG